MKNLKRILSLALASTMLIGMMVVGASAAFVDADDIEHTEAVETMAALGVIEGTDEGKFNPEGKLDRAAMAKMIAVIMNKGTAPLFADTTKPSFVDVKAGNWAVPYIEYCANLGYIAGYGNGYFGPNDELTGTQAARMILNALGYKWDGTGNWELATEVQARDELLNLYKGLDEIIPGEVMTRDAAAQMLYNALNAPLANGKVTEGDLYYVVMAASADLVLDDPDQLAALAEIEYEPFETYFEAYTMAINAAEDAKLGTDYTITKQPYSTVERLGEKYLGLVDDWGVLKSVELVTSKSSPYYGLYKVSVGSSDPYYIKEDTCSDMIGNYVTVLYKTATKVYGVLEDDYVMYEGTVGEYKAMLTAMPEGDDKDDLETALSNLYAIAWNGSSTGDKLEDTEDSYFLRVTMNPYTGLPGRLTVKPYEVATVSYLTATNINIAGASTDCLNEVNGKLADVNVYEGIAKGDLVMVTPKASAVNGKATLSQMETVEGTISGLRGSSVLVDGTWYSKAGLNSTVPAVGSKGTLTLVNGYYVAFEAEAAAQASTDIFFVTKVGKVTGVLDADTWQARVITKEGKKQDINIAVAATASQTAEQVAESLVGKWHTYTEKSGVYTLSTDAATAKTAGYVNLYTNVWFDYNGGTNSTLRHTDTTRSNNALRVADDAVVIILYNDGSSTDATITASNASVSGKAITDLTGLKPMTGKDLKAMGGQLGTGDANLNVAFTEIVNGIEYVKFVFIANKVKTLPDAVGTEGNYGYIVSSPYTVKISGVEYTTFDMWNGEENVTVNAIAASGHAADIKMGAIITYDDLGEGFINEVEAAGTYGAVVGINGDTLSILTGATGTNNGKDALTIADLDEHVKIFYVDSAKMVGQAGGSIQFAQQDTRTGAGANKLFRNVKFKVENGKITVLFVEINNAFMNDAGNDFLTITGGKIDQTAAVPTLTPDTTTAFLTNLTIGATFTVSANNPGASIASYQWQKCATDSTDDSEWENLSGANKATYTANAEGYYRVKVTVSYKPNSVAAEEQYTFTSTAVQLTKLDPATPAAQTAAATVSGSSKADQEAGLPDGVFSLASGEVSKLDPTTQIGGWNIQAADAANFVYFKYNAPKTQKYTLSIYKIDTTGTSHTLVYQETSNNPANQTEEQVREIGVHFCGVDKSVNHKGAPANAWKNNETTLADGTSYYYEIKGADGVVYANGTFDPAAAE